MGNISFPVPYQKIPVLEDLNKIRINVYGYEDGEIYILHVSDRDDTDVINLLLISNGETSHYCLIRNFSRFMAHRTKHDGVHHFCYRCLHGFMREDLLEEHLPYCRKTSAQAITMPEIGKEMLKFKSIYLEHKIPFVIYADFESLLVPISSAEPSSKTAYQVNEAQHVPCGYAYVIVGPDGRTYKEATIYNGPNAVKHFLDNMLKEKEVLGEKLKQVTPMKLSEEENKSFKEQKECSICNKPLGVKRVRDHDHVTGQFRGAAHSWCNLQYKQSKTIPVVFHNLKNYDGHHIMTELGKYKDHTIDVIATTLEKYMTFKIRKNDDDIKMSFIDSFQFLPASLDKLSQSLNQDQFTILKENFPANTDLSLLTRKGVYCYEYFDNFEKFDETELPPKSAFYNTLNEEEVSDEDYAHAQKIWGTFKLKNLAEFHNLYVKTDVLLLADIFQNFRDLCLRNYKIDAAHLVTSPGLSWQACLKMTKVELELLTDPKMLMFIEQGIRGGVSQISHRSATANNVNTPSYDPTKPTSHIMYWDANNLYGWAMSQYLPDGAFRWMDADCFSEEKIGKLHDQAEYGYIFEVDLEYPESLHDLHNDYPLAPEKLTVQEEMLSEYATHLLQGKKYHTLPKLIPNLLPKKMYICHYRNLKLYLNQGMKISKIHKVLEFHQSPWLKNYIDHNTSQRQKATTTFEKDYYKLLNNSVYGKCIENLRKRRNITLCSTERRGMTLTASPNFITFKEFDEDLVAVERKKPSILMNRPIYVGFAILELSKVHMYDFHYNFIKKLYPGNRAILLFTDTDSLTYKIESENLEAEMKANSSKFDFSEYPTSHPLFSNANKKVLGKFKDELGGETAFQFIGLKSKMYSIKTSKEEKKRAKGVSTRIVRKKIKHQDYVDCLSLEKSSYEEHLRIGQQSHRLFTIRENKKSLSPFDDKRYLLPDGISSYAYGHYRIDALAMDW